MTAENDEFAEIPGMPSADEIRANLLKVGDVPYWRPFGKPDGTATDFAALSPKEAERVINARMVAGPGPNGTAVQWALFEHYAHIGRLEKERDNLQARLVSVSGYDRDSGEGISAISPEEAQKIGYLLMQVQSDLERANGEGGQIALRKKLDKAVKAEQARIKSEYRISEAKKRAQARALDEEIERLSLGFSKTQPRP